jgi:DNA-binding NarL/FixJ family response regulator
MEAYFSLIHHEDIKPVTKCFDYMKSVVAENSSILLPTKFRFVFYYRMRTLTGNFITIRDEKLIIKNQMNRHVGITLLSNVSKDNLYFTVKVELNKYLDNHLVKVHEFVPRAIGNMFTNRELEVIKLIDQGLSNIDIAERLNISIHTVKNHRKNVSKKANVRNSLELIRFARNENII